MEFATITIEHKDQIGILTLNRPDKMNTFSSQLAQELNEGLRRLDQDDQVQINCQRCRPGFLHRH